MVIRYNRESVTWRGYAGGPLGNIFLNLKQNILEKTILSAFGVCNNASSCCIPLETMKFIWGQLPTHRITEQKDGKVWIPDDVTELLSHPTLESLYLEASNYVS